MTFPVGFVSTHVYANDTADNVLGTNENIPRDTMVWRAVKKVMTRLRHSTAPKYPAHLLGVQRQPRPARPQYADSTLLAAVAGEQLFSLCDGLTQSMAYWAFSDVFEEQGVVRTPFYGGFGLIAADQ